jgi:CRP-like cAMP-binding protein
VKGIKYFSDKPEIKENDLIFVCEHVRYEQYHQGENIINVGEYGDKFYVIIEGEVQVLVPPKKNK